MIAVWLRRERERAEYQLAYAEADRLGAVAEGAKFRMLMVVDDPDLHELAEVATEHVHALYSVAELGELKEHEAEFVAHMSVFVAKAAELVR